MVRAYVVWGLGFRRCRVYGRAWGEVSQKACLSLLFEDGSALNPGQVKATSPDLTLNWQFI